MRVKTVRAAAGCALAAQDGVSKAMPPASSATSDSVRTLKPPAPADTSTPLAFQKRVLGLT